MAKARVGFLLAECRVDGRATSWLYVHPFATCQRIFRKLYLPTRKCKQGMVSAHAYKIARMKPSASLPDNDISRYYLLQEQRKIQYELKCSKLYTSHKNWRNEAQGVAMS